ncbi:HIT-like protein [Sodiomyces alkalinus F11]|uniref:HIT-like protein n=1 Tax=Sodiomyces alkalinus (strain CBS 110278 / VKM F-3762 / F11) TaxID=1314773 RepID=A0A3N2PQP7_SODAK|nr:HIT-like protein [Sodiomyces alkalinus F11]ROT36686.1 HIT-like protein [Sodiomyces alkalinus F11]
MTPSEFEAGVDAPESNCPFCTIADHFPPFSATSPPRDHDHDIDPTKTTPPAFVVLSTGTLVAFLDIMPLSRGHLLLCPRTHRPKLTDVSRDEAADLGRYLRVLSKALSRVTGVEDWNVVQNNGAAAAQVVMHMHFHLIPRPEIRASGRYSESFTMFGRGKREDLDEDDADQLARELREAVAEVLREEEVESQKDKSKL